MKLAIDGYERLGHYRVDCECGQHWSGQTEHFGETNYAPALPIAECVVHMRMCHEGTEMDIRFSLSFVNWLTHYWELMSLRQAVGIQIG